MVKNSDTLSYDRPAPPDGAGRPTPASRPDNPATAVLPDSLTEDSATAGERPGRTDPLAVAPAPQVPISLTPSETPATGPVAERAPGAFRAGDQVDHFEIVGLVGQGGMGCVYKALDRELGRTVAIKTLHGIDQHQPQSLARFRREAQAALLPRKGRRSIERFRYGASWLIVGPWLCVGRPGKSCFSRKGEAEDWPGEGRSEGMRPGGLSEGRRYSCRHAGRQRRPKPESNPGSHRLVHSDGTLNSCLATYCRAQPLVYDQDILGDLYQDDSVLYWGNVTRSGGQVIRLAK